MSHTVVGNCLAADALATGLSPGEFHNSSDRFWAEWSRSPVNTAVTGRLRTLCSFPRLAALWLTNTGRRSFRKGKVDRFTTPLSVSTRHPYRPKERDSTRWFVPAS